MTRSLEGRGPMAKPGKGGKMRTKRLDLAVHQERLKSMEKAPDRSRLRWVLFLLALMLLVLLLRK